MDQHKNRAADRVAIVLASASEARRRMLASAGIEAEQLASNVDEEAIKHSAQAEGWEADVVAQTLAESKALAVARLRPGVVIVGADQVLECDGRLFDKPRDRQDAASSLRMLRGRVHRLISAVAVVIDNDVRWRHTDQAVLTMRAFSDEFLEHYLDAVGDAATSSVGAYQLEGMGVQLFSRVEGDFFTVLGLPLLPLMSCLREYGILDR